MTSPFSSIKNEPDLNEATDALELLTNPEHGSSSLMVDLNDLLRRDPTLSSLAPTCSDTLDVKKDLSRSGLAIPKRNAAVATAGFLSEDMGDFSGMNFDEFSSYTVPTFGSVLSETGFHYGSLQSSVSSHLLPQSECTLATMINAPLDDGRLRIDSLSGGSSSPCFYDQKIKMEMGTSPIEMHSSIDLVANGRSPCGPTLTELNASSPIDNQNVIKLENLNDLDDFFMNDEPPSFHMNMDTVLGDFTSVSAPPEGAFAYSQHSSGSSRTILSLRNSVDQINNEEMINAATPCVAQNSSSFVGPERNNAAHRILLRKKDAAFVRSPPESRTSRTLEQMRNSLSPLLGQPMSKSAPSQSSYLERLMWARREPRPLINSVCSVGSEATTIGEEVADALAGLSPSNLPDIVSDEESSESELDGSNFSSSTPAAVQPTSNSKDRYFWMYNVQAKGPKGHKIKVDTTIEDPHILSNIVDPVFHESLRIEGIKHNGKARRGDGNDLTSNPKKLAAIGRELEVLSKKISKINPSIDQYPRSGSFSRNKNRREKNKLASRACRLKKKAQHEANKLKVSALQQEQSDLLDSISKLKSIVSLKGDFCPKSQALLTMQADDIVAKILENPVAGDLTEFVNREIDKYDLTEVKR